METSTVFCPAVAGFNEKDAVACTAWKASRRERKRSGRRAYKYHPWRHCAQHTTHTHTPCPAVWIMSLNVINCGPPQYTLNTQRRVINNLEIIWIWTHTYVYRIYEYVESRLVVPFVITHAVGYASHAEKVGHKRWNQQIIRHNKGLSVDHIGPGGTCATPRISQAFALLISRSYG